MLTECTAKVAQKFPPHDFFVFSACHRPYAAVAEVGRKRIQLQGPQSRTGRRLAGDGRRQSNGPFQRAVVRR